MLCLASPSIPLPLIPVLSISVTFGLSWAPCPLCTVGLGFFWCLPTAHKSCPCPPQPHPSCPWGWGLEPTLQQGLCWVTGGAGKRHGKVQVADSPIVPQCLWPLCCSPGPSTASVSPPNLLLLLGQNSPAPDGCCILQELCLIPMMGDQTLGGGGVAQPLRVCSIASRSSSLLPQAWQWVLKNLPHALHQPWPRLEDPGCPVPSSPCTILHGGCSPWPCAPLREVVPTDQRTGISVTFMCNKGWNKLRAW